MFENIMDIDQVAAYLHMNKMTIYKLARSGKIPAFKVASEWRFRKEMLDAWMMSQIKGNSAIGELTESVALKKLLIVDDEDIIRDFFTRSLKNFNVITTSNGHEAIEMVKKERPDLVLLDIQMPGIDGIETLKQIKGIDNSIAVIMLSAHGTLETNVQAARLGAFASMAKPFDLSYMISMINNALLDTTQKKEAHSPELPPRKEKK